MQSMWSFYNKDAINLVMDSMQMAVDNLTKCYEANPVDGLHSSVYIHRTCQDFVDAVNDIDEPSDGDILEVVADFGIRLNTVWITAEFWSDETGEIIGEEQHITLADIDLNDMIEHQITEMLYDKLEDMLEQHGFRETEPPPVKKSKDQLSVDR